MSGTVNLRELFLALQEKLEASLKAGQVIGHAGAKGEATEIDWRGMLKSYLPSRYQIQKAFVVDANGVVSDEIDVVIFDRYYSPLLFTHGGAVYVPSESVYAVLEIKPNLSKQVIEYAGKKADSVRRLRRTSAPVPQMAGGTAQREPFPILAGILCLGSDWDPPLGTPFKEAIAGLAENERIDLGCVLQAGGFEVVYESSPAMVTTSAPDASLIFFFLRLLERLRALGNVPAIDLTEYGRTLTT